MGEGSGQLGKSSGELAWGVGGRKKREQEGGEENRQRRNQSGVEGIG